MASFLHGNQSRFDGSTLGLSKFCARGMPGSTLCSLSSSRFQASKILRNLQGKMGHACSPGLTGTSALLPTLPHIREIYGQLVYFGHCSTNFWPQGPALDCFWCDFVPRPKDCNRHRCEGRLAPVVKTR